MNEISLNDGRRSFVDTADEIAAATAAMSDIAGKDTSFLEQNQQFLSSAEEINSLLAAGKTAEAFRAFGSLTENFLSHYKNEDPVLGQGNQRIFGRRAKAFVESKLESLSSLELPPQTSLRPVARGLAPLNSLKPVSRPQAPFSSRRPALRPASVEQQPAESYNPPSPAHNLVLNDFFAAGNKSVAGNPEAMRAAASFLKQNAPSEVSAEIRAILSLPTTSESLERATIVYQRSFNGAIPVDGDFGPITYSAGYEAPERVSLSGETTTLDNYLGGVQTHPRAAAFLDNFSQQAQFPLTGDGSLVITKENSSVLRQGTQYWEYVLKPDGTLTQRNETNPSYARGLSYLEYRPDGSILRVPMNGRPVTYGG